MRTSTSTQGGELVQAAARGNIVDVRRLLEQGVDIESRSTDGDTSLMWASYNFHLDVVRYLIDHDAQIDAKNRSGNTALVWAAWSGNVDAARYLVEHGAVVDEKCDADWTALVRGVLNGHLEVVKYLVEHGADVQVKDNRGISAVMWAVTHGHLEVLRFLVQSGADIRMRDNHGRTALMVIPKSGHLKIVTYLAENGLNPELKDDDGCTALMKSASDGNLVVVRYLVDRAADVDVKNNEGDTALMLAVDRGFLDIVSYLVEHGADADSKNNAGWTALMRAVWNDHLEVVGYLVEHGADTGGIDMMPRQPSSDPNSDTRCQLPIMSIRSVSSGQYLIGRATGLSGPRLVSGQRKPATDAYLQWVIGDAGNGHIFIKSVSSGQYLDGRNPGVRDPLLCSGGRNPATDACSQWVIGDAGNGRSFIKSVSSGQYLDGRNPGMQDPIMSSEERNPATDVYLQWDIVDIMADSTSNRVEQLNFPGLNKIPSAAPMPWCQMPILAFKSVSSRQCLDGRKPGMRDPILSSGKRKPATDAYLQWVIGDAGNGHIFIKSVSSGQYLDGRNPGVRDPLLCSGGRNPATDACLQWVIGDAGNGRSFIKSVSSGQYLDGRNPGIQDPLLRSGGSNPASDACLLWIIESRYSGRMPALKWAAHWGHLDLMRILVAQGNTVDSCDSDGRTLLMLAASGGHLDIMRYLVDQRAALDAHDKDGKTPLIWAACSGQLEVVRFLVVQGADVDACDCEGWTSLMWAAKSGHLDMVGILVEHGADIHASFRDGQTTLILAASCGNSEVVRYLVENGADVDSHDNHGSTPLGIAAGGGHIDVVCFLVENGAEVDSQDKRGNTPLGMAAGGGHFDVVRYLVEKGADSNYRDNDGNTPLCRAAGGGHLNLVQFLMKLATNPALKSSACIAALSIANMFGRRNVVRFLLPLVRHHDRRAQTEHPQEQMIRYSYIPSSWIIPPFELQVEQFVNAVNIGGDYRGKWLDADVVVKLFVDDASSATFADEVRLWHQLRHPNILKLYGVCNSGHHLFVCEYASKRSLPEYLKSCDIEHRTPWKFLYEAALGLEYLHERKIVHGNLRGSNILIGSDGLAKLSGFGLSSLPEGNWNTSGELIRWASPESLEGNGISLASDVYSLGMCIIEAVSGEVPFYEKSETHVEITTGIPRIAMIYEMCRGVLSTDEQLKLLLAMCHTDPHMRLQMPKVVSKLEHFAEVEAKKVEYLTAQAEPTALVDFDEFDHGKMNTLWSEVQALVNKSENNLYRQIYCDLTLVYNGLKTKSHLWSTLQSFHDLLTEIMYALKVMSDQNRVCRLSATRARDHSVQGLHRRITQLLQLVCPQEYDSETRITEWKRQCRDQAEIFVSEASEACVLLSSVDSEEDRSALVAVLHAELSNSDGKYTDKQLAALQETCDDIVSKSLEDVRFATTPEWFIPWFELEMNEMATLGVGGFGSVIKAKWLDSEVVVKKLEISEKDSANADKKRELRQMFEREVDIWFGLSHPHVVRLFGACHVGRPFFVCELAPNGTLDKYLKAHPDEIWVKLREAALGVQYLHARGIVHGDLKGNNILIGSDGKAKVTDFGLSGVFGDDSTEMVVSGAWHWVAPECLLGQKPSFASDVYSIAMCIIEALRVTNGDEDDLPWGALPNAAVKFNVTRRHRLPPRPQNCSDEAWTLIERICKSAPADRMLIMTVVDELEKLADRHGDLNGDADQPTSNTDKFLRSLTSVADVITEMNTWLVNCDTKSGWEGGSLEKIYQLHWNRLEQMATQLLPEGDDVKIATTTISEFSSLVERSQRQTLTAISSANLNSLVKFTELALGGYALHRRLDKFMAAHGVPDEPRSLHDWTSACCAFMGASSSQTPACSDDDCSANEETGDGKRVGSSTKVTAAS